MSKATATLHDGREIEYLSDVIGEGGKKRVHFTADRQAVVCFYKDQASARTTNNLRRLQHLLDKWNPTIDPITGGHFVGLFCWPTAVVVRPELGILAPKYPENFFFATGRFKGKEKNGKWFSSPKLRQLLPPAERGQWLQYLQLCILMARGIRKMHLTGLAHSDLSCNNVLVDPAAGKSVIIDVDALVVDGLYPPEVIGTRGYIAPEVVATMHLAVDAPNRKLPNIQTDLHSLAVLFYEYLLRRHPLQGPRVNARPNRQGHVDPEEDDRLSLGEKALFIENPKDASNRPKNLKVGYETLGPYLQKLFSQAFVEGLHNPQARPTAPAWEGALYRTSDLLIPCRNAACEEKWFVYLAGQRPKCPWCGWCLSSRLPLLEFHYAPHRGQFQKENHSLVAWDGRLLHLWHAFRNVQAGEGVDREPLAQVVFQEGQWILFNHKLDSLVSPSGNPVPRGRACPLLEGGDILLSREEHGRLVSIRFIP